jgi:OmpA-OmpF porin, OOP family
MMIRRTFALAGAVMLIPVLAFAQVNATNQGYLVNGPDFSVVTAVGGTVCVRTSDWTPARAAAAKACQQCTPDLCPKPVAAAPVPPKAAPTPPPKAVEPPPRAAPEKLLPQKINFSAEALFDFDKAVLKPEGKAMLDDLVRTLQGAKYEVIIATGHADRFGSVAYNQRLSERRANAVRDYLAAREIPLNRISATGKGKSQPVTKPNECKGPKSAKVLACLQPDRRVDVEVNGTK